MAFTGVLKVTDGTPDNTISFLATSNGIVLSDWKPQTHQAKDGGIWASSQFSDGRQMVMRNWANAIETYEIDISGADMDGTIKPFRKLLNLLTLAGAYWVSSYQIGTGAAVKPIWIEALGDCESETRYAYIYDGTIPELINPHDSPFAGLPSAADQINAIIEHGLWRDTPPGQDACLKTSSYVTGTGGVEEVFYTSAESDTINVSDDAATLNTNTLENINSNPLSGDTYHTSVRFTNVTIDPTATILSAYIKWISIYDTPPGDIDATQSTIYGELALNPPTYTTYANWAARVNTVANARAIQWDQPTLPGEEWTTDDLAPIIQEIIDQPGWASGNSMAFKVLTPGFAFGTIYRIYAAHNDPTYSAPELHIVYETDDMIYGLYLPVCANNFAVGYNVPAQIEHVERKPVAGGWSGNILYSPVPWQMFFLPLQVGDKLYIGSTVPFSNFIFDLTTAGNGTVTYKYWYSTAGGISAGDLTGSFIEYPFGLFSGAANDGIVTVVLSRPFNWEPNALAPLPNMYWITIEITNIAIAPAITPTQDVIRQIYTTAWNYWEVAETEVLGDVDALLKFLLIQINTQQAIATGGIYNSLLIGARTYDRGPDFSPFLNATTNKPNIMFSAGPLALLINYIFAPDGTAIQYATLAPTANSLIGTWRINTGATVEQYYGRYRVFVRGHITIGGTAGLIGFSIRVKEVISSIVMIQTGISYNTSTIVSGYDLTDLGYIAVEFGGGIPYINLDIELWAVTTGAVEIQVLDLILFPADEGLLEVSSGTEFLFDPSPYPGYQPMHDSTKPKEGPYSAVVDENSDMIAMMQTKSLGQYTIANKKRSRIYFLPFSSDDGGMKGTESLFDAKFRRVLQFRNMRGDE